MSHTYGEVLPISFPSIFAYGQGDDTAFVDVGCGYGSILAAAIQQYGCSQAVGIEKYEDKFRGCLELCASISEDVNGRIKVVQEDINDCNTETFLRLLNLQNDRGAHIRKLLIFCNNVAFNQGTIHRSGSKFRAVMDILQSRNINVVVISMMPLRALSDCTLETVELDTTWNERHLSHVYKMPAQSQGGGSPVTANERHQSQAPNAL